MKLPILYSRTAKGAINTWQVWTEGPDVVTEWGQQGGQLQVARFTCQPKNVGKKNSTTAEEQAVLEAQSLHIKKKKAKYNESLESAGETKRIKPMLAQDFEKYKHKVKYPATCQPKYDGVRALAYRLNGKVVLQSRGGDFYDVKHITDILETRLGADTILDGEVYVHGMSLQAINSLIRRPQEGSKVLQYWVYDIVNDKPWATRKDDTVDFGDVERVVTDTAEGLVIVDVGNYSNVAENEADVYWLQSVYMKQGFEGAIVRTPTGLYREGYRSPDLLKVKSWKDAEFVIHSFTSGKGKFENVPTFTCLVDPSKPDTGDNTFDVTPKGTEQERRELLDNGPNLIGKLMKVKFFDFSPYGIPLYPVGLGIRDKSDLS
jgi:DNA ligase-1